MMDTQLMTAVISGRTGLPTPAEMYADIAAEHRFLTRQFPGAARYGLELDPVR